MGVTIALVGVGRLSARYRVAQERMALSRMRAWATAMVSGVKGRR